MDIFHLQPATEEDPDEGIKDLVEITLKKFVSTLATNPPPPQKKNFNTITLFCISCYYEALSNFFLTLSREVLHMSLILYKVTGFFLLVLINFRQYNSVAGVPFRF